MYIVPFVAVSVSVGVGVGEGGGGGGGGGGYVRDRVLSRPIGAVGEPEGVDGVRDGGADVIFDKPLKNLHVKRC